MRRLGQTDAGDAMTNSLWAQSVQLPSFAPLEGELNTDVLIVGGGLAGLLCAYLLAQEGVSYALIEADTLCHGVTRNTTAKITSQHGLIYQRLLRQFDADTARLYHQANVLALERYRRIAQHIPCDLEEKDAFVYALQDTGELDLELDALNKAGIHADFVKTLPLPFSVAGGLRFANQAQFHPLRFAAGIARELQIYEHTPMQAYENGTVVTPKGVIRASRIIMATHFPILNKHGGYSLKLYQDRSYVLALRNAQDVDGMYLDASGKGLSFRNQEDVLLIGGGSHRTGKRGGGWQVLEAFAKEHYPAATEVCRWATQDCMTLDGVPYIGPYSKSTPNLFVATGFHKWGMTSSMVSAMILCDLVQGRDNPYARVFDPSRTAIRPQLFANALQATLNLLTPTAPRCPHLGCALKWNRQEHSWDCPCHGSRFTENGALLDNPATGNLKRK